MTIPIARAIRPAPGDRWDYDVDPGLPYAGAQGIAGFLGTRRNDGGRPARYAEWIAGQAQTCETMIGIGCGDSHVEAVVARHLAPPPRMCLGIDIAGDAASLSAPRFTGTPTQFRLLQCDWHEPGIVERIDAVAGAGERLVLFVGRTFGNADSPEQLAELRPIVRQGSLYVDGYAALAPGDEARFEVRMREIAVSAANFFTAPLVTHGLLPAEIALSIALNDEVHALRCDFLATGRSPDENRPACYRLFSIRMFRPKRLAQLATDLGYRPVGHLDLPDQLLPMALLRFDFSG